INDYIVPILNVNQYKFLNWEYISSIELHPDEYHIYEAYLNWDIVSEHVSYELALQYKHLVNWDLVIKNYKVDIQDMECNEIKFDFTTVIKTQELSESFIDLNIHRIQKSNYWDLLSQYQTLSESFIKKHIDKFKWSNIIYFQKHLSKDFIIQNISNIEYGFLCFLDDIFTDDEIEYFKKLKKQQ